MAHRRKAKADHQADTGGMPWAGLPHVVLNSLAYQYCDLWERAILVELVRVFNGFNNGSIALSQRQIGERLHTSNWSRIGRSIAGLMEKGLIDVSVEGQWKERLAREYRLTFAGTGKPPHNKSATNEYRTWQPAEMKSGAEAVSARRPKFADTRSAVAPKPAEPPSSALDGNLPKSILVTAEPASSLIVKPYVCARTPGSVWWAADVEVSARGLIISAVIFAAYRCQLSTRSRR